MTNEKKDSIPWVIKPPRGYRLRHEWIKRPFFATVRWTELQAIAMRRELTTPELRELATESRKTVFPEKP